MNSIENVESQNGSNLMPQDLFLNLQFAFAKMAQQTFLQLLQQQQYSIPIDHPPMTTTFSRMNFLNLKQRRSLNSHPPSQDPTTSNPTANPNILRPSQNDPLKLHLPQPVAYEPTNPFSNSRTSMRMLKGKIDKMEKEKAAGEENGNGFLGSNLNNTEMNHTFKPRPEEKKNETNGWNNGETGSEVRGRHGQAMKLVLPEEDKAKGQAGQAGQSGQQLNSSKQGFSRKILIEPTKETKNVVSVQQAQPPIVKAPEPVTETRIVVNKEEPKQEVKKVQPPEEQIENENELVECPEGCGRKFNKKALETHTKACKIVFMSKRKEFNSQAKRISNKEQATLVKQAKQKEKKQQIVTKNLQKSGQAWKTQSQGFRAVVKALKQQDIHVGEQQIKSIKCQFCEKLFNQVLYPKHLLICDSKKQKQRQNKPPKKPTKKY